MSTRPEADHSGRIGGGSRLVAGGLVFGAIVAMLVGRLLQTLLFDVPPSDPMALGIAAFAFGVVALVACLLPAVYGRAVSI
jgi:putative effector of murein hydrolase